MRHLSALIATAALTGCAGNTCVSPGLFVGDQIRHLETGQLCTITERHGTSDRCSQPGHPILTTVECAATDKQKR